MNQLSIGYRFENDLGATFASLKNLEAVNTASHGDTVEYFGNMAGVFVAIVATRDCWTATLEMKTSYFFALQGNSWKGTLGKGGNPNAFHPSARSWQNLWQVRMNDTQSLYLEGGEEGINNTEYEDSCIDWEAVRINGEQKFSATFYMKDLQYFNTDLPSTDYRIYEVNDSSGRGYNTKRLSPRSPKPASTFNVTAEFEARMVTSANITDRFPNAFDLVGGQIYLKKFKLGVGEFASATVGIAPVPEGSSMRFRILCTQAPEVLQSIAGDEYVTVEYLLKAPAVNGTYTLPLAEMECRQGSER